MALHVWEPQEDFDRFKLLLSDLRDYLGPSAESAVQLPPAATDEPTSVGNGGPESSSSRTGIDVRALHDRLNEVGASSDIERVTVMTQSAIETGLPSLDYPTADKLFEDLGLRKPTKIRATFQNAKARGMLRSVGQGAWRTTVAGENFARYGHKPPSRPRGTSRQAESLPLPQGGGGETG